MSNSPFAPPLVLNRGDWRMRGKLGPALKLPVKMVVLHHSVTPVTAKPVDDAQAIADVGSSRFGLPSYSYLIHPARVIFEMQGTHRGAHTEDHNSTAVGICLVGNYDAGNVPDSMIYDACYALFGLRAYGVTITSPLVVPHRLFKSTACPGAHAIEKVLPFMRAVAADPSWRP